jgi:chaperonin cofactor prefoldin
MSSSVDNETPDEEFYRIRHEFWEWRNPDSAARYNKREDIIWLKENCNDIYDAVKIFEDTWDVTYNIATDDFGPLFIVMTKEEITADIEERENTEPLYARIAELEKKNENLKIENERLKKESKDLWDLVYLSEW